MANMIKQYEKVRAFKCSSKEFPELGIVIAFAYNYSEIGRASCRERV